MFWGTQIQNQKNLNHFRPESSGDIRGFLNRSLQTFVYNSILFTGHEFNCTMKDFLCLWHWFLINFNIIQNYIIYKSFYCFPASSVCFAPQIVSSQTLKRCLFGDILAVMDQSILLLSEARSLVGVINLGLGFVLQPHHHNIFLGMNGLNTFLHISQITCKPSSLFTR